MLSLSPEHVVQALLPRMKAFAPEYEWSTGSHRGAAWLNIYDRAKVVVVEPSGEAVTVKVRDNEERRNESLALMGDLASMFPELAPAPGENSSFVHPSSVPASTGHFYLAQTGHFHLAATFYNAGLDKPTTK